MCVGHKDKTLKKDRYDRDLLYYTIKGWADPKKFTMTKERFWSIEGDDINQITMPTQEELMVFDQKFRSLGNKKWLE